MFNNKVRQSAFAGVGFATVLAAVWLEGHFALFAWLVASGLGRPAW